MTDDIDFGFTAVDEEELRSIAPSPASNEVSEKLESTGEGLKLLEYKMDNLVDKLGEMLDEVEMVKEYYNNEKVIVNSKLKDVENLILPLLNNLMKNKEKEYIYWPNREAIITQQINRITSITRVEE